MLGRSTMSDSAAVLPWLVIRQDINGSTYRVGRYATQEEAQKVADGFDTREHQQLYWVERAGETARP
ncbi:MULTISPECIES: SPOR domain-containing protein [unclassified Streptomyces]|uniref:SPOR domain-containing protein n=1 Tax=unclassified Streptomyces TaxID=2593676 RepID=UPI0022520D2E|nr:SPOR domain-containing protein [Streptomyces sp. NBC_00102]MCX5399458.1 SPOR domain-containing protein [Streptomyces sp. NBC_00102]